MKYAHVVWLIFNPPINFINDWAFIFADLDELWRHVVWYDYLLISLSQFYAKDAEKKPTEQRKYNTSEL